MGMNILKMLINLCSFKALINMTTSLIIFIQNLKYPSTEVCTNRFNGHLNVSFQMVKYNRL